MLLFLVFFHFLILSLLLVFGLLVTLPVRLIALLIGLIPLFITVLDTAAVTLGVFNAASGAYSFSLAMIILAVGFFCLLVLECFLACQDPGLAYFNHLYDFRKVLLEFAMQIFLHDRGLDVLAHNEVP